MKLLFFSSLPYLKEQRPILADFTRIVKAGIICGL